MNDFGDEVNQTATDDAEIDMMIGVVRGDVYYNTTPTPTPQDVFESGQRYLASSIVDTARAKFSEAIGGGLRGGEVCFYFVLALMSGRTREQLSESERQQLKSAGPELLPEGVPGPAERAARLVLDLVDLDANRSDDVAVLFDRLDRTPEQWRTPILRHLEFVMDGQAKNALWERSVTQANDNQMAGDRLDRAWKFFHPEPDPPEKPAIRERRTDRASAIVLAASSVVAVSFLIQLAQSAGSVTSYALLVLGLAAVATCVFLVSDLSAHRRVRFRPSVVETPAEPAPRHFAGPLKTYCERYASDLPDPKAWLAATASIREAVAWELALTHPTHGRGQTGPVRWLIRHRAGQIRRTGLSGNPALLSPELVPPRLFPPAILATALIGTVTGLALVGEAVGAAPLPTLLRVPVIALAGYLAVRLGLEILGRRRETHYLRKRAADEHSRALKSFAAWQAKLSDSPDEGEMAEWLSADRVLLIDRALKHYKLEPRRVLSHGILESPDRTRRPVHSRARVPQGPWRYRHYALVMFLLSNDGIRQVTTKLDFNRGELSGESRENFRYDTICSFRVETTRGNGRLLKLRRLDGNSDDYEIVTPDDAPGITDDPAEVADISADAAGLHQAIHLLEGIAAEGKGWIGES
ncbi:hypothetical protein KIH74_28540 [Kineosporia sp. J2-2]|uniref:Uncharacterized protein n=1 Tax=Kineosporia corallincola TaxID=2835133 RepID=A0ABS5TPA1_9ACTN|nr:hypothetical protein [Kineosporia corallincola]MBT0772925.1 hypothetical protein [Kineosporia corallincola]